MTTKADDTAVSTRSATTEPRAGRSDVPRLHYDADKCTGCGQCELMCALYHAGDGGPRLARLRIDRHPLVAAFEARLCAHCWAPSCYAVCTHQGEALCLDDTGIAFVDPEECSGCKACVAACPFDPPRMGWDRERLVAFKCDLCRGRQEGPICVEFCPVSALSLELPRKRHTRTPSDKDGAAEGADDLGSTKGCSAVHGQRNRPSRGTSMITHVCAKTRRGLVTQSTTALPRGAT